MNTNSEFDLNKLNTWIKLNYSEETVRNKLIGQSLQEIEIEKYLDEYRKVKSSKKFTHGFSMIGIGGFIGLIACILSMIIEHPHWNSVFLYGATSLGVIVVMYGLYQIFE